MTRVRRHGNRATSALTLVEVVCAAAILALLAGAVLSALAVTLRGDAAARDAMSRARAETGLAATMRQDLWGLLPLGMEGEADIEGAQPSASEWAPFLSFNTTRSLARGAWDAPARLLRVEYSWRATPDGIAIFRAEAARTPGERLQRADFAQEHLATVPGPLGMEFFDGEEWRGLWRGRGLPHAIRLLMGPPDGEEGQPRALAFAVWTEGARLAEEEE